MQGSHHSFLLFSCLLALQILFVHGQGSNISFSPNSDLCLGDEIEMVCFVETSEAFAITTAFVSINSSRPFSRDELNMDTVVDGIDLSLFSADIDGLTITTNRPGIRLIIRSYQTSDSATLFGCHGFFPNASLSSALISQPAPSDLAGIPLPPGTFKPEECFGVKLSWLAPATDRAITQYYLYRNSSLISTLSNTTTQYTDTDPLILNAAYLYSLAAASCAGNSTSANISIPVPGSNFEIRLNISENSLIEPGLTLITASVPLSFNFILSNDIMNETLNNIAYSDLNSQSFPTKFIFDVCYRMTCSYQTCSDQVKEVNSNYFILPGVRNGGGSFQNVSTLSSHRLAWIYQFDSPLCSGSDLEEYYFISTKNFAFLLYRNETQESVSITEFDLNFPLNFTFTIPPSFDILNEIILLRILFNGDSFTEDDIVLSIPTPLDPLPPPQPTTIILGSTLGLLLILLGIVVAFIIIFIILWMKKQGDKKWQRLCEKIRTCFYVMMCLCVCKTMCPGLYEKMCPCLGVENYPCHCIREEEPEEGKHPYN